MRKAGPMQVDLNGTIGICGSHTQYFKPYRSIQSTSQNIYNSSCTTQCHKNLLPGSLYFIFICVYGFLLNLARSLSCLYH